jgi:hypothetical protein
MNWWIVLDAVMLAASLSLRMPFWSSLWTFFLVLDVMMFLGK